MSNDKFTSNYTKLYKVLKEWYSDAQIDEIWALLKKYDAKQNV